MRHVPALVLMCSLTSGAAAEQWHQNGVAPLIRSSCIHCHDADTETGLNLPEVGTDLSDAATFRTWEKVFDFVRDGRMPPKSEDGPDPLQLKTALHALEQNLRTVSLERQHKGGRVPARRLTKLELGYTLRDLLLIERDVTDHVPDEVDAGSFDTVGATQRISPIHMESYLTTADEALDLALQFGKNPHLHEEFDFLNNAYMNAFHELPLAMGGSVTRKQDDGVAMFIDADYLTRATNFGFFVQMPGTYRITSTVAAIQSDKPVTAKLILREPGGGATLLGAMELQPDTTETMTVSAFLKPGDDFYLTLDMGQTTKQDYAALIKAKGAKNYKGKGILIKAQEVEGPLFDSWPPGSTRQLLKDVKLVSTDESGEGPFEVVCSQDPVAHINEIVSQFATKAFRRPATEDELQSFAGLAGLAESAIADGSDFMDALRVPLRSILSSPQFLLFHGDAGKLDDYALASRLSYFLWKSLPDQKLLDLAAAGRLSDPKVLTGQVERLLNDEKSDRFVRDFTGQWLRLYKMDATTPDKQLYPEYDELLGDAMRKEPQLFFTELLHRNFSATNLIDSDFTFVNSRLAKHYGFPDVDGHQFRRYELPKDSPRGGVLTQAAILKTTANGTVTSPVMRGNFVLTNFLGTPPAPPPPSVGSIDPDTQGKTTVREILAAHRSNETCNRCHREIDPPGFALECFDPIGGFRTHYRATWKKKSYKTGLIVDASGVTADGQTFSGVTEFRQLLLKKKDQVAKNFISQLVVYATGGEIQFADRGEIEKIFTQTRANDFPVRDIIHAIVQSRLFREK